MEKTLKLIAEQLLSHHGDVVIERLAELPKSAKKTKVKPLAYGEISGHKHEVTTKEPEQLEFYEDENGMYFRAVEGISIRHTISNGSWTGEHNEIDIEPSPTLPFIKVKIQKVEDPYTMEIEKVKD